MCQWCGAHGDNKRAGMISDIHSNYRRELLGQKIYIPDNEETAEKRKKVSIIPDNANYLVELGDALVYQMRYHEAIECFKKAHEIRPSRYDIVRKLAIRYLTTLQIDKARECFKWCLERTEDKLDEQYRLALLDYYEGNYRGCIEKMQPCYEMTETDGEMRVAVLYWDLICRVKLNLEIDEVIDKYSDDIDCGHHLGYQQALRLFKHDDLSAVNETEGNGELCACLYFYGLYHYYLYKGDNEMARNTIEYLMTIDLYFSSFAFLGAFTDYRRIKKEEELIDSLQKMGKVAIAFSGGVDSTCLLSEVIKAGVPYKAYYVRSPLQANHQVEEALEVLNTLNANYEILDVNVLQNKNITKNSEKRCYFCKRAIFNTIKERASKDGFNILVDGTNKDDMHYERPGVVALQELDVMSPLEASGLSKNEIRQIMRENKIIGADKPANSCLATRLKTNEKLSLEALAQIEAAEQLLREYGYVDYRVRVSNNKAVLEFNRLQKEKAEKEFDKLKAELKEQFETISLSDYWR